MENILVKDALSTYENYIKGLIAQCGVKNIKV